LVAVRTNLETEIVKGLDVELISAARAVRRVTVHIRADVHLLALRGKAIGAEIVHADADVFDRSGVREFVQAEEPVAEPEIDAAIARPADDLRPKQLAVEVGGLVGV